MLDAPIPTPLLIVPQYACGRSRSEKQPKCKYMLAKLTDKKLTKYISHRTEDNTLFLGDGSLAGAPAPKLHQRGIRNVIKVMDERCL